MSPFPNLTKPFLIVLPASFLVTSYWSGLSFKVKLSPCWSSAFLGRHTFDNFTSPGRHVGKGNTVVPFKSWSHDRSRTVEFLLEIDTKYQRGIWTWQLVTHFDLLMMLATMSSISSNIELSGELSSLHNRGWSTRCRSRCWILLPSSSSPQYYSHSVHVSI